MAQTLRALAILPEDMALMVSKLWFTTINSGFQGIQCAQLVYIHTYTQTFKYIQ